MARLLAEPPDLLDDAGGVGDRVGVGHGVHRGVAAEGGGAGAGLDGLRVLPAGLAEVGVQVDQARQSDEAPGVDRLVTAQVLADLRDDAVADQDVDRLAAEDPGALDDDGLHWISPPRSAPPSSR
ncbi:hypothetical protein GCM10017600_41640 [Streptosporangium carneum]|uniref:Uncharacterized protein n=1 Tax=Streptosporangium carneum TaxID=47481 RepID=A0A9W6I310_9ACTN|nr:hypothetical protein GCM10017600_41640 [Streptosporangium carneum]